MKKQLLFLMLVTGSLLAFTGCSKDDDDVKSGDIQGRWDLATETDKVYVNGKIVESETDVDNYNVGERYILFSGNKASTYEDGMLDFEETFTISGDKIIFKYENETFECNIKWNNNNQVVITQRDDDGPNYYEITESIYNRNK